MSARRLELSHLRELVAAHGLRTTGPRLEVLRALASLGRPVSHSELAAHLADAGLERTTVYRNLVALTHVGVLVRTQLGDGVWRFELPSSPTEKHREHPHFVCTRCGQVACLAVASVLLQGDVVANEIHDVQVRGRCSRCRA